MTDNNDSDQNSNWLLAELHLLDLKWPINDQLHGMWMVMTLGTRVELKYFALWKEKKSINQFAQNE